MIREWEELRVFGDFFHCVWDRNNDPGSYCVVFSGGKLVIIQAIAMTFLGLWMICLATLMSFGTISVTWGGLGIIATISVIAVVGILG
jgi:hypothetical protein